LALVFTSLAVLSVVGVCTYAAKARNSSDERRQASLLATSLAWRCIERLAEDFDNATLPVAYPPGQPAGPELDATQRFLYGIEVQSVGNPPGAPDDLKQIRVTVGWESKRGPQTYVLTTKTTR
jgi:hypothetical protein